MSLRELLPGLGEAGREEKRESEKPTLHSEHTAQKVEGREVLYKPQFCWPGVCRAGFGKGIQRFKGGKTPEPKAQTFCSLPAAMALERTHSKK